MFSSRIKLGVFILEGLNSFAVTFYLFYFYFYTHARFGFGDKVNLTIAAASGLVCMFGSILGGRFAQHRGCFNALKIGFGLMLCGVTGSLCVDSSAGFVIALMMVTTFGMTFTWAPLEALIAEGESYTGLQRNIGIYNIVWALTGAIAYFIGGVLLEKLGLRSLFVVPLAIQVIQLGLTACLHRETGRADLGQIPLAMDKDRPHTPPSRARAFLRMAWLANPFSYIASNTLIAVMPGVAQRLELSTALAGICCSVWCFARLGAFVGLWLWPGWHYRFRWLLVSYLALIIAFAVILLTPSLAVVVMAQLFFGIALGLIYYSSLFYSMDVGETKGEHGGIHEAAIGLGNFAGPAVGAASLQFSPVAVHGGAGAVVCLLVMGLFGMVSIQIRSCRSHRDASCPVK